jgi:hypothetical protein
VSDPKRYTFEAKEILDTNGMICFVGVSTMTHPMGKYVSYEDYARLKAEVERLTAFTTRTIIPNEQLQAQVERLTKAGDAMAAHIERNDERCYIVLPDGDIRISEWNAAKEGKPRA